MSVSADDVIRVTATLAGPSGRIENVYHFRVQGAVSTDDLDVMTDLAQKLDDSYDLLGTGISSDTTFVEVSGYNVTGDYPMPTVPWPTQTAGTGAGGDPPAGVSMLAVFRTGVARAIGRKFLGGLTEGNIDTDGFWTSALVAAGAAFAGSLLGQFTSLTSLNTYVPGILQAGGQFLAFISAVVTDNPAYQRRRRKGRGI